MTERPQGGSWSGFPWACHLLNTGPLPGLPWGARAAGTCSEKLFDPSGGFKSERKALFPRSPPGGECVWQRRPAAATSGYTTDRDETGSVLAGPWEDMLWHSRSPREVACQAAVAANSQASSSVAAGAGSLQQVPEQFLSFPPVPTGRQAFGRGGVNAAPRLEVLPYSWGHANRSISARSQDSPGAPDWPRPAGYLPAGRFPYGECAPRGSGDSKTT